MKSSWIWISWALQWCFVNTLSHEQGVVLQTVLSNAFLGGKRENLESNFTEICSALHWRHNDHNGVSNHQPHGCLLNRLFGRRSKKTSKFRVTGLSVGNSPGPVNSPHRGQVTRKCFHLMTSSWRGLISINSGKCLMPKRRKTITWTNDDLNWPLLMEGLAQGYSNSIANALGSLQPLIYLHTSPSGLIVLSQSLQWRHNNGISNPRCLDCLLNRLYRRRPKKTSKLRVTGLCEVTGDFPSQRTCNAENVSIW